MWGPLGASPTAMTRHFQAVADALATGCLLAGGWNWLGARRRYLRVLGSRLFLLVPCGLLAVALATSRLGGGGGYYIAGQSIANLAIALGIDRCVRFPGTLTGRLLNTRPLAFVGVLSYSLYLWQELFLNPFDETSAWTAFPVNLALAVLAALASYHLVERPFLSLKARVPGASRRARPDSLAGPVPAEPSSTRSGLVLPATD
jgi:peptidoglycan/LPS O-acetylase OafA/YrhL